MRKIEFNEARHLQLEMLKAVDIFCRANGIVYYLAFGTLLGAVRHKGFIPWDDDIDIMFPEPELKRFCKTFKSDKYHIISADNDMSHNLLFPKLYDIRTASNVGNIITNGIGIDLYGIYGLPSSVFKHLDYINKFYRLWNQRRRLSGLRTRMIRWRLWPKTNLTCNLLHKSVLNGIKHQQQYPYGDSEICMIDTRPAMPFLKSLLGVPVDIQFEDGLFYAPQEYEQLLTLMYGNYKELPPESQRVPYHGYDCYWK